MPQALETHELYTIGWIAALPVERAVAEEALDEEHDRPLDLVQPQTDNNSYTWGRIGDHNIVIAALEAGVYGNTPAAVAATSLLSSFPQIRFGLLVGIGGGIPKPGRDLWLGDIAVSQPIGNTGGVVQYDIGKAKHGGLFERKDFLNKPPPILLNALSNLQAKHQRRKIGFTTILQQMADQNPDMFTSEVEPGYEFQGVENDLLFDATYEHVSDSSDCNACNRTRLVDRDARRSPGTPKIHYGIIASGNKLVKDATAREALLSHISQECICYEMEAAGLMNNFPCLVIRGICDYADSHKNDRWQPYAAACAAAFAKELLAYVPARELSKAQKAKDLIEGRLDNIEAHMKEVHVGVQKLSLDNHQIQVLRWLSPPDPSYNQTRAIGKRHQGTGLWFLQSRRLEHWKTQPSFLWLHGLPGCGKTVLSAAIIGDLQNSATSQKPIYFYFDFNDVSKQSLDSMIRSFIDQIYHNHGDARQPLDALWSSHGGGHRQPSLDSLLQTLSAMISKTDELAIIIDALDESNTRDSLLTWMKKLYEANAQDRNLHLLVTSRKEEDIYSEVSKWCDDDELVAIPHGDVNEDIRAYVHATIKADKDLSRRENRLDVQEEIETRLMEKADGMFRWATCQLDALKECFNRRDLKIALSNLPEDLDETYARILSSIPKKNKPKALRALQLLTWSERPLRLEEVIDAMAIQPDEKPGFDPEDRMPRPRDILRICSSLVALTEKSNDGWPNSWELQLAHSSVKEYLVSERIEHSYREQLAETKARGIIGTLCLTYLLCVDHQRENSFPFAEYSARYWTGHARIAEAADEGLQKKIMEFFDQEDETIEKCFSLWDPDWIQVDESRTPLYFASLIGLKECVKSLLGKNVDVNAECGQHNNALEAATVGGHNNIVQILLDKGADVHPCRTRWSSPLQRACEHGNETIMKTLINKGADVNLREGTDYHTALMRACDFRHSKAVQILLDNGADVNARVIFPSLRVATTARRFGTRNSFGSR